MEKLIIVTDSYGRTHFIAARHIVSISTVTIAASDTRATHVEYAVNLTNGAKVMLKPEQLAEVRNHFA